MVLFAVDTMSELPGFGNLNISQRLALVQIGTHLERPLYEASFSDQGHSVYRFIYWTPLSVLGSLRTVNNTGNQNSTHGPTPTDGKIAILL